MALDSGGVIVDWTVAPTSRGRIFPAWRFGLLAAVVALLTAPAVGWGATRSADPTPATRGEAEDLFEGLVADAGRTYGCVLAALPPARVTFAFVLLRFNGEANAARHATGFRRALEATGEPQFTLIVRGVIEQWFAGEVSLDGSTNRLATLLLRDGADLHLWYAVGPRVDTLRELGRVAQRFLDDDLRPAGVPATSPLLDRLPGVDDMPARCVLTEEGTNDLVGSGTPISSSPAP